MHRARVLRRVLLAGAVMLVFGFAGGHAQSAGSDNERRNQYSIQVLHVSPISGFRLVPGVGILAVFMALRHLKSRGPTERQARKFHTRIEQRSGGSVSLLVNISPNDDDTHRFLSDRV